MPLKLHQDELPTINLTSMIDILFLLIIFFMVGTNFGLPEGHLLIDLPKIGASSSTVSTIEKAIVEFQADGSIFLDGKRMNANQLTQQLASLHRQKSGLAVSVRGDGGASFGTSVQVTNAIRSAGIKSFDFAVSQGTGVR